MEKIFHFLSEIPFHNRAQYENNGLVNNIHVHFCNYLFDSPRPIRDYVRGQLEHLPLCKLRSRALWSSARALSASPLSSLNLATTTTLSYKDTSEHVTSLAENIIPTTDNQDFVKFMFINFHKLVDEILINPGWTYIKYLVNLPIC